MNKVSKEMARECGIMAFDQGIKCAPCLDARFIKLFVEGTQVGESIKPMKMWIQGWTQANLQQKI